MNAKSLLFVSDHSPNRGLASPVIFHRHLGRLADEGWQINLLLSEHDARNYDGCSTWQTKFIPSRLWWYPPFRPYGILAWARYEILAQASASFIAKTKPGAIIGYLRNAYYSGFAAFLSRKHRLPLGYFYHDATELFPDMYRNAPLQARFSRFKKGIIRQASIVWAVSERMVAEENTSSNMVLLYPLSERVQLRGWPAWRKELAINPILVHAGTVYDQTVEPLIQVARALAGLSGQLLLQTPSTANAHAVVRGSSGNVVMRAPESIADVCKQIVNNASGLLVAYPRNAEDMPWIKSCFPSKFVQFTATGLPCYLVAPRDSALHLWAESRAYPGLLEGDSVESLQGNLAKLLRCEAWEACAERCRQLWKTDFSPDRIHRQFATDLERLIAN